MQKIDKKWSILIWSIFLVIFTSFSFIAISNWIWNNINKLSKFNDLLDFSSDSEYLEYSNSFTWWLKAWEATEFRFSWSAVINTSLVIVNWWPIQYKILELNNDWTDVRNLSLSSSWIVANSQNLTLNLDWTYWSAILYLKNLWWFTNYNISSASEFLSEKIEIIEKERIWNKEIIKKRYIKQNFEKGLFSSWNFELDQYKSYWMYNTY